MTCLNETTNKLIEESYAEVRGLFENSGKSDFVSFWLSIRDQFHLKLDEEFFFELNRKIIREHGESINS